MLLFTSCNKNDTSKNSINEKVLKVVTGKASIEEIGSDSYYIGTVEASEQVPISFTVPGTIEKVYADEGQMVKRGQKLAELINTSFKSSLKLAQAQEKQAKDAYDRLSKVHEEGSLAEIKFVEIESKLQQAESMMQIAEKNLSDCLVKSPISGVVGRKNIEAGANVMPSSPIMTIFKIDQVMVKISVPENEIPNFKIGNKAKIRIPALGNFKSDGVIKELGMVANMISHTYDVKISVQNKGLKIRPGMVCNVYFENEKNQSLLSIPNNAILTDNSQKYVFILNSDNNTVRKQEIETGNFIGNNIVVKRGISQNDNIIIVGQQMLYNNAKVSVLR